MSIYLSLETESNAFPTPVSNSYEGLEGAFEICTQKVGECWDGFVEMGRNLVHGDRDEVTQQIKEIAKESRSQPKEQKMLILEGNGSWKDFPVRSDVSKFREFAKTNSLDYCPISDEFEFRTTVNVRKWQRYDTVLMRGHGSDTHVQLGEFDFAVDHNGNFSDSIIVLAKKVKEGGRVIFEACSVGSGEENCAKEFSTLCPSATVYASSAFHDPVWGMTMDEKGVPSFSAGILGLGGDSTRIYKDGELLSDKS